MILRCAFRQLVTPRMLYGVGDVGGDYKPLNVVVDSDAVSDSLRDGGGEFLQVCCGTLLPIEGRCHNVDHHLPDRFYGWLFGSPFDSDEQLVDLIFIDRSEVWSICCAEDWIGELCANNRCNRRRYFLLYPDRREPCGVLSICFVLRVGICCDFRGDNVDC